MATTRESDEVAGADPLDELEPRKRATLKGTLREEGLTTGELARLLGFEPPTISRYKAELRDRGFLDAPERKGPKDYSATSKSENIPLDIAEEEVLGDEMWQVILDAISGESCAHTADSLGFSEVKDPLKKVGNIRYKARKSRGLIQQVEGRDRPTEKMVEKLYQIQNVNEGGGPDVSESDIWRHTLQSAGHVFEGMPGLTISAVEEDGEEHLANDWSGLVERLEQEETGESEDAGDQTDLLDEYAPDEVLDRLVEEGYLIEKDDDEYLWVDTEDILKRLGAQLDREEDERVREDTIARIEKENVYRLISEELDEQERLQILSRLAGKMEEEIKSEYTHPGLARLRKGIRDQIDADYHRFAELDDPLDLLDEKEYITWRLENNDGSYSQLDLSNEMELSYQEIGELVSEMDGIATREAGIANQVFKVEGKEDKSSEQHKPGEATDEPTRKGEPSQASADAEYTVRNSLRQVDDDVYDRILEKQDGRLEPVELDGFGISAYSGGGESHKLLTDAEDNVAMEDSDFPDRDFVLYRRTDDKVSTVFDKAEPIAYFDTVEGLEAAVEELT